MWLIWQLDSPYFPERNQLHSFVILMCAAWLRGHILAGMTGPAVVGLEEDESRALTWFVYFHITSGFTGFTTIQSS